MSDKKYPLEWLDILIEELKSYPTGKSKINKGMSQKGIDMLSFVENEIEKLKVRIREEIFAAVSPKKNRKLVANYYHETTTYYINILYGVAYESNTEVVAELCSKIHNRLRELLGYLEIHFQDYLKNNRKVPKYEIFSAKQKLRQLVDKIDIRSNKLKCTHTRNVIGIVQEAVEKFINQSKYSFKVTHQCIQYRLELLNKILYLDVWEPDEKMERFPLDSLLIYMNFNSKTYISYLTSCLSESLEKTDETNKIELLLGYYKEFRQLHIDPNYAFNPKYHCIMDMLDKWIDEELNYFRKVITLSPVMVGKPDQNSVQEKPSAQKNKVVCTLSGDQIALLLRAADEVRMLSARSLTAVFRSIVPYIATRQKEELSYESIRIKSYNAEQTDKEITIHTLRRMIDKIQNY